jgi:hypothetical protein
MSKRQFGTLSRISLAAFVLALWSVAALPASAQYAVSSIKHDASHVEEDSSRPKRLDATASTPIPRQPAWLAGSNLGIGQRTESLPRSAVPVATRPEAKAILVGDWAIHIRPARDEWDRRPATQTGTSQTAGER